MVQLWIQFQLISLGRYAAMQKKKWLYEAALHTIILLTLQKLWSNIFNQKPYTPVLGLILVNIKNNEECWYYLSLWCVCV